MTARWWDEPPRPAKQEGRRPPAPDFRRKPTRPPFPRWTISIVAYGIKLASSAVVFFVVGMVGLFTAPVLGLAGAQITEKSFMAGAFLVIVAIEVFTLALQVRYIVRQGAERAVTACLVADLATLGIGELAGVAGIPALGRTILGTVIVISVVALLIRPPAARFR